MRSQIVPFILGHPVCTTSRAAGSQIHRATTGNHGGRGQSLDQNQSQTAGFRTCSKLMAAADKIIDGRR